MTSPSVTVSPVARDVEVVCCTGCCPAWRASKGTMKGHSVTHHKHPVPKSYPATMKPSADSPEGVKIIVQGHGDTKTVIVRTK